MKNSYIRRFCIMLFIFIFTLTPVVGSMPSAKANQVLDLQNHWAERTIMEWLNEGLLKGYSDGTIRPDQIITRGEAMALVNRAFKYSDQVTVNFSDLKPTDWEYDEVRIAMAAEYIKGYEDGTIRTKQSISRQEAAVVVARLLQLNTEINEDTVLDFADAAQIPDWSLGAVMAVVSAGIMQGYSDGKFKPDANITRAELIVSLNRSIDYLEANSSEDDKEAEDEDDKEEAAEQGAVVGPIYGAPGPTQTLLKMNKVSAENGSIRVEFNRAPDKTPSKEDFHIIQVINGADEITITVDDLEWDGSEYVAQLTVPEVVAEEETLSIVYKVSFLHTAVMESVAFTVDYIPEISIVANGESLAVIIIEDNAAIEALEAADALERYIKKATGAIIPVLTVSDFALQAHNFTDQIRINIDHYTAAEASYYATAFDGLDDQGFVIRPHEDTITIIGPTAFGTRNGAYDFLERYADIRWLMPGPEGVDIPQSTDLIVPMVEVIENPVFAHRLISAGLDSDEWWKANKLQLGAARTVRFQENLYTLFPSHEKFSSQPCFTKENADVAVAGIIDYFDKNPTVTSFSLGINDNRNFCETDPSHPDYPDVINSIGYVNMSDIYYAWVNEVVEQVLEVYPDKWFGLLAYYNVMDPPSFPVHPRVVPFITKDRMAWLDDDIRAAGHQQMDDWQEKAEQIGWYDYMYGTLYVLPRVYPHLMAETLQYAAENNVYGHYNEMYHNAGDGPKAWLNAKLMWNPDQDVDALLQEWYERTVGTEAAEELADLYDYWEDIWTDRMQDAAWFIRNKDSTYFRFEEQDYVEVITKADFDISMPLIESVVAKAETSLQKSRANKLLSMFKYYEASALSYVKDIDAIEDETTALAVLDNIEENLANRVAYGSKRDPLWVAFSNDPILRFRTNHWYQWFGYNRTEFWHVVNYLRKDEPNGGMVTDSIVDLASNDDSSAVGMFANMLHRVNEGSLVSYTTNSSFEAGSSAASPWTYWNPNGTANIGRVTNVAHTGSASLLVANATHRAGAYQIFDVQSGLMAAEAYYYSPPGTDRGGVRLVATLQGTNGKTLGDVISPTMPLADTAGAWASVNLFEWIPTSIKGETVKKVLLNAQVWEAAGTQVYLDDVNLYVMESDEHVDNSIVLTQNGSFEEGDASAVLPWKFWNDLSIGTMKRTEDMARTGEASLEVANLVRGGVFQHVEGVGGDELLAQLYFYTEQDSETTGEISIVMHALAQNYERLQTFNSVKIPLSAGLGKWTPVEFELTVPATINGKAVARFQVIATIDKAQDAVIYIDDFDVYKK